MPGIGNDSPVRRIDHEIHERPVVLLEEVVVDVCAYHSERGVGVAFEGDAEAGADAAVGAVGAEEPGGGEGGVVAGDYVGVAYYYIDFNTLRILLDSHNLVLETDFDAGILFEFVEEEVVHAGLSNEEEVSFVCDGHVAEFGAGHVRPGDAIVVEEGVGSDEVEDAEGAEGAQDDNLVDGGSGGVGKCAVLFEYEGWDAGLAEAEGDEEAYRADADDDDGFVLLG